MDKQRWLNWAEVVDSWRVVPRVFLTATFLWTVYLTERLMLWYIHLPHAERGVEASGFASVVQVGVLAFLKMVFSEYSKNGRDWNQQPTSMTTTTATISTT